MKNKKAVYLLIGCVAIVWGLIIYRIYITLATDEEPIHISQQPMLNGITVANHTGDKYQLHLDRDPFSNSSSTFIADEESVEETPKIIKQIIAKQVVKWPIISYKGYINNTKSHQKLTLISINAKELMMAEGSKHQGIQLLKNMGDSIKISFNHETKYININ